MKALVIGGTGPTGPYLINGLVARGYDVTMMNRGSRDSPDLPAGIERIAADPHFEETFAPAIAGRQFDLVIATYGRIRMIADLLVDKTPRLIAIGGAPGYRGMADPEARNPPGMALPTRETDAGVATIEENKIGFLIRKTEKVVMDHHVAGAYNATLFRYPVVYGPRQIRPRMWWIMQRVKEGRSYIVLPDGGLSVVSRGYAANMAHGVLLAVDKPEASAGNIYNCADEEQLTMKGWVDVIVGAMGASLETIGIPDPFAFTARELFPMAAPDHHQLLDIGALIADLDYRDVVPVRAAMAATVAWCEANPPEEDEADRDFRLAQYRAEDEMVGAYRKFVGDLAKVRPVTREFAHSYAHPRKPGEARDHRGR